MYTFQIDGLNEICFMTFEKSFKMCLDLVDKWIEHGKIRQQAEPSLAKTQ